MTKAHLEPWMKKHMYAALFAERADGHLDPKVIQAMFDAEPGVSDVGDFGDFRKDTIDACTRTRNCAFFPSDLKDALAFFRNPTQSALTAFVLSQLCLCLCDAYEAEHQILSLGPLWAKNSAGFEERAAEVVQKTSRHFAMALAYFEAAKDEYQIAARSAR